MFTNPTSRVYSETATELIRTVHDLAAAATDPRIDRRERAARVGLSASKMRDLEFFTTALDPYADRSHSRVDDLLHQGDRDADERLALAEQRDMLRAMLGYATRADAGLSGAIGTGVRPGRPSAFDPANWLRLAEPIAITPGTVDQVPDAWDSIPTASIDGAEVAAEESPKILGDPRKFRSSSWSAAVSAQTNGWSGTAPREIEALIEMVVNCGLETALVSDLASAAGTAATLEAAETAVGVAWPSGADLILVSGTDRLKVIREYAAAGVHPQDRPTVLGTAGVAVGSAIVLAQAAIVLEATPARWTAQPMPTHLGSEVGAYRYGRVSLRIAGAAQKVTLA